MSITNVSEWLASSATINPLHNMVVVSARLAEALARSLNLQKIVVEDISNKMNVISDLTTLLIKYKNPSTTDVAGKLGKDLEECKSILSQLAAQGAPDLPVATTEVVFVKPSLIAVWQDKLSANRDSLSNLSQQETLKLQTFTSRYGQANDLAATLNQKDTQGKNTFITNLRGN
jgi:hypothetical protein